MKPRLLDSTSEKNSTFAKHSFFIERLEPRILLSADGLAGAVAPDFLNPSDDDIQGILDGSANITQLASDLVNDSDNSLAQLKTAESPESLSLQYVTENLALVDDNVGTDLVDENVDIDSDNSTLNLGVEFPEPPANESTYTVTNTLPDGPGSLRDAITLANLNPGIDTINFNIEGSGPQTIQLTDLSGALPIITDSVIIDATTQPGYEGTPIVELDGSLLTSASDGLVITAGNSTVTGLAINGFSDNGISLISGGNNIIEGNYIGADINGSVELENTSNGILISDSPNNQIGGLTVDSGNILSGNNNNIEITGSLATGNLIQGNTVVVTASDPNNLDLGDMEIGILIHGGANNNIVGENPIGGGNIVVGIDTNLPNDDPNPIGNNLDNNPILSPPGGLPGLGIPGSVAEIINFPDNPVNGATTGTGNGGSDIKIPVVDNTGNLPGENLIGADQNDTTAIVTSETGLDASAVIVNEFRSELGRGSNNKGSSEIADAESDNPNTKRNFTGNERIELPTSFERASTAISVNNGPLNLTNQQEIAQELDGVEEQLPDDSGIKAVFTSALKVTLGLSLGYLAWLFRGMLVLGGFFTVLPTWQFMDRLPVLANRKPENQLVNDEESLESMVESAFDSTETEPMHH